LIAVSVASAIMPDLASRWSRRDVRGFEDQFSSGLRVTLAVLIPVAWVYVAVAQPFIELAIHHGRVSQSGAHLVSSSLALFAIGLPGFSAYFLLMRVYQATQDGKGMFWIYALENGMTIVAALVLDALVGVPGLALAWVGPYTIAAVVAAVDLRRRVASFGWSRILRLLVRVALASGVAVAVVVLIGLPFPSVAQSNDAVLVGRLLLQAGAGALVYIGLSRIMRIEEVAAVLRLGRQLVGAR
jgi:putative peptidoglycan lipid II flippase